LNDLNFTELARAAYSANRLLDVLNGLHHYASTVEPADLAQAKDMLGAVAEVCRNAINDAIDKHDQGMAMGIPSEAWENDSGSTPGTFDPRLAEESIRYWRLRKSGNAV
jgi:hypothetical protein